MTEVDSQHRGVVRHRDLQRSQDGAVAAQRDDELAARVEAVGLGARPQVDDLEAVLRRPRLDRQQLRRARAGRLGEHAHGAAPGGASVNGSMLRQRCRRAAGLAVGQPAPQGVGVGRLEAMGRQPAGRAAVALVDELERAAHRLGPGKVRLRGAALEVGGVRRRRAQARQQRLDALAGGDVVGDHRGALHPGRLERQGAHHPGPVLARGAVHDDAARRVGDVAQRAHHQVGTVGQVSQVGLDDEGLAGIVVETTPLPRQGAVDREVRGGARPPRA